MSELSDREKLIMVTGFLMGAKANYPKLADSVDSIMKLLGLDKIATDYLAGKLK